MESIEQFGVESPASLRRGPDDAWIVQVRLCDEIEWPAAMYLPVANGVMQFIPERDRIPVVYLVYGVQPEAIQMVVPRPVQRVSDDELSDAAAPRTVKIQRLTPGRAVGSGKKRREAVEAATLLSEVIVNDVEEYGNAAAVAGVDEPLQSFGTPVVMLDCVQEDAVVAPIALTGTLRHGHQLYRSNAKCGQVVQARDDGIESSFRRERADMEFVEDHRGQRPAPPCDILPNMVPVIDDLGGAVHSFGLRLASRIGALFPPFGNIIITVACRGVSHPGCEIAFSVLCHGDVRIRRAARKQAQGHRLFFRRPDGKMAAVFPEDGIIRLLVAERRTGLLFCHQTRVEGGAPSRGV